MSFDTQRVIDRLREGGWNEEQAYALCDVLREITRGVAMASDVERVESSLRHEIQMQMTSLRLNLLAGFGFLGLGILMALLGILVAVF